MKQLDLRDEGEETRVKAYSLNDFLQDCKNCPEKVIVDGAAIQSAENSPLNLHGEREIIGFLSQLEESEFNYVNTKTYRKGRNGEKPPVDSYTIKQTGWDLYVAFCFMKTNSGWFVKSFHPDNSGETMSIGNIILAKLMEK